MIIGSLHKQMVALDRNLHRNLKIHQPQMDWSVAAGMNSLFVAGAELATAPEAAERLGISEHSVKFHVQNVCKKLGVNSRVAAVVKAIRLGLIVP